MIKRTTAMLCACLLAALFTGAQAAGVTIRTFTPFADMDFAAQGYMDLITQWEEETGNMVEDYSGVQDDMFFQTLGDLLEAGEADVVVLPLGSGLTENELVTAGELLSGGALPGAKVFASMVEGGHALLAPVRLNWEALYVNTDVLERYGLATPQTFERLLAACMVLGQNGVLPLANALCEWPEIVLDCAALSGAPQAQYGQGASLDGAKSVLTMLAQVGAFGSDPWNMTDMDAEEAFLSGAAAMRIDADGLAQMIDASRHDSVVVLPLPAVDGQARTYVVGTPGFGVAITRSCWQDDARTEAALSFAGKLLTAQAIVSPAGGKLGESIAKLTADAQDMTGLLYDLNPDGFDTWAEGVVASLMAL